MKTCSNCPAPANLEYTITAFASQFYCYEHAPKFLKGSPLLISYEAPVEPPVKTTKKKSAAVVEEPVVEETPVIEEVVVEETPAEE